jgi:MFS family permease
LYKATQGVKNKQAIYLLFAANSISGFAQGISMIAIPWYFTNVLKVPSLFGQIFFVISCISIFWGLYAGTLVDRYNRKNIFLGTAAAGFTILFSVSMYGFHYGNLPAALVALVFSFTFFIYNIHYPNLYAFVQEISDPGDYGKVASYIEVQGQITTAIAGAVAAILLKGSDNGYINILGTEMFTGLSFKALTLYQVFLLDAVTYVLGGILVWRMTFIPVAHRHIEYDSIWVRLKTGYGFLKKNTMLLLFGMLASNVFVAIIVINFFLKPAYVENFLHKGADVYASYEIYFALGSLFAGLAIRYIFRNTNAVKAVIILFCICAMVQLMYTFNTNMALFYIGALFIGLTNAGSRIMRVTYIFHHTPNQLIGRTGGVFNTLNLLYRIFFIGIFSSPFFFKDANVVYAFGIFGGFILLSALLLLIYYRRIINEPVVQ